MEDSTLKLFFHQFTSIMIVIFSVLVFLPLLMLLMLLMADGNPFKNALGSLIWIWTSAAIVVSIVNAKFGLANWLKPMPKRTLQLMFSSLLIGGLCPIWWWGMF